MSFIQIGFLAALAALAIPVIVHLVFRQRAKKVELGTLRFLRVVLEHNARRRRVMRMRVDIDNPAGGKPAAGERERPARSLV